MSQEVQRQRLEAAYRGAELRTRIAADLAMLWVKSLLLVNGGAIVGLTAMMPKLALNAGDRTMLLVALGGFAFSAITTLVALLVGYVGQVGLIDDDDRFAESLFHDIANGRGPAETERSTAASWVAAIGFGTTSLVGLVVGLVAAVILVAA